MAADVNPEPPEVFTEDNLPDLQDDLYNVRHKWYDIGLRIGLSSTDLDPIKYQNRDDFKDCLRDMLKLRLSRAKSFSKGGLLEALRKPSIGEDDLAAKLEEEYFPRSPSASQVEESQAHGHTDDVVMEDNDSTRQSPDNGTVSEDLTIVRARLEKENLVSEFECVAKKIKGELKTKMTVSEFRDTFLLRLSPTRKALHLQYFEQNLGKLANQTTYDGLFCFLNFYWDYLNYSLLETIVKRFGSSEIKRRMGKFCKDVKSFRGSTTLRVFRELEHDEEHPPPPDRFQMWKSMHNITLDSTLEDINTVRMKVTHEFQLQEFALNIAYLEFSSVFVIWLLPQSVVDILKCGLSAQLLDELHIESITPCSQDAEDIEKPIEESSEGLEVQAIGVSARAVTSPAQQKLNQQLLIASRNVFRDDVKRVQALLEQGADPHSTDDRHGRTPLMWASFRNNPKTVEALLHHSASSPHTSINAQDSKGWGAFTLACEKEYINIATLLLGEGANIDLQNAAGWSALMRAAYTGKQKMTQFLLEKGANTEMKDKEGWTALMAASQRGHKKVAQMLLEFKADPNAGTERGMTALMSASQGNHLDIVRLLKKHGATVNLKRTDGVTALHIACDSNNIKIVDELYQTEDIELDAEDEDNFTPLMIASKNGHGKIVKLLFGEKKKADPGKKTALGWTALSLAVSEGKTEVTETLLQNGADPTVKDRNELTLLDIAKAQHRDKKIYKLVETALTQAGQKQTTFQDPQKSVAFIKQLVRKLESRLLPQREEKLRALRSPSGDTPEQTTAL